MGGNNRNGTIGCMCVGVTFYKVSLIIKVKLIKKRIRKGRVAENAAN